MASDTESTITPASSLLRRIMVRFSPLIRKQRWLIAGSSMAMIVEVAFKLLEPWPLKFIFDRVIVSTPAEGTSGFPIIDDLSALTLLTLCAIALVVVAGARAVSSYLNRVGFALAGNRVLTESRSELFSHLQRLSLSYHNKTKTGDLITRVTGDIGRLKEVVVTAVMPLMIHFFTLLGMLLVMFLINWKLSLVSLAVFPLFIVATKVFGGRIRKVAKKQRKREGEIGATTAEAISSIREVQALSLERVQEQTFSAQNKASLKEGVKGKRLTAKLVGTVDVLIAFGTAIVLFYGARLVIDGALTPGDLIVYLAYLKNAFKPTRNLAKYFGRIAKASASAERVLEVFENTPLIVNRRGAVDAPSQIETIQFNDVTFSYDQNVNALDSFSLAASCGQVIALAGPSGAGKTTVLSLLLRLYDPQSGSITVNGNDIRDLTYETLRQSIAIVPQDSVLFAVSIRDNIAYGTTDASEEEVIAAAKLAHAHEFITEFPIGYDTILAERGDTLSQGQRQRISIARAAIRNAPILVLDEPTSSLDNENNRLVCESLRELRDGKITFIIAHDLSTVEEANTILFLDHGMIVEKGSHNELLNKGGRYAAMFAMQRKHTTGSNSGRAHAV